MAPEIPGVQALAEKLVQWAAQAGGRIVGSFACAIPRLVCNLVGDAPMVRHADEWRFCRKGLPLGFTFVVTTGTVAARRAIVEMIADTQHPFLPVAGDGESAAELVPLACSVVLQRPTQVLLSVAGLFEDVESLPEAEQYSRAGIRRVLRDEHV